MVHALQVWRCFLEGGKPVKVVTDHNPLVYLPTQLSLSRRQARWSLFLSRFDLEWEYRPGRKNVADPLSRHPLLHTQAHASAFAAEVTRRSSRLADKAAATVAQPPAADPLAPKAPAKRKTGQQVGERSNKRQQADPAAPLGPAQPQGLRAPATESGAQNEPAAGQPRGAASESVPRDLISDLQKAYADPWFSDPENTKSLTLHETSGLWLRGSQYVVPNVEWIKASILHLTHDAPFSGHIGTARTLHAVERLFWWPGMRKDVTRYVTHCPICARDKPRAGKPPGALKSLPIPSGRWVSVGIDFIPGLPETKRGHNCIMLVIDRFSKMVHVAPMNIKAGAVETARLFIDLVFKRHGMPESIVSDRDPRFTSAFFRELTQALGTKLAMSTAFHPQTDGLTERANRTLQDMLRHYVGVDQTDWDLHLALAEFAINNSYNESTGTTPFRMNHGEDPRLPSIAPPHGGKAAKDYLQTIQDDLQRARRCLEAAQQRQKAYYDRGHAPLEFEEGDLVMLSTRDIKLKYDNSKLKPKWLGPFEISKVINDQAYELDLRNPEYRFHPVFHISKLRAWKDPGFDRDFPPQPPMAVDRGNGEASWEVERIVRHEKTRVGVRYLVKWVGYPLSTHPDPAEDYENWLPRKALPKSLLDPYLEYLANTAK